MPCMQALLHSTRLREAMASELPLQPEHLSFAAAGGARHICTDYPPIRIAAWSSAELYVRTYILLHPSTLRSQHPSNTVHTSPSCKGTASGRG